jgi:plasmid stability protein
MGAPIVGQVIVRNLDDDVIERHRERARARGVSLEQELRDALTRAAAGPQDLVAFSRQLLAGQPEPPAGTQWPSAEELIREGRDSR